jgi:erythromycin esterase
MAAMKAGSACLACVGLFACTPPDALDERTRAVTAPPAVHAWIADNEIPLATVEARHGFADLAPLAATIGDARVVALGEATHGTREFFQLKHRLLEYLVEVHGFTVFGFEAGLPEGLDVDDYVVNGRGDPARAVAGLGYWPWTTEEVVELVRWMRAYNRTHARKVRFVGFDMQVPDRALREVLAYLGHVDPAAAAHYATTLHLATSRYDFFASLDQLEPMLVEAEALLARFDSERARYEAASSRAGWTLQRQLARVVVQSIKMTLADVTGGEWDGMNLRDLAMADNVEWILATGAPDTKVVLWAHNDHVSKTHWAPEYINMGAHLDGRLGSDLRVIGFGFDRGDFQALGSDLRLQSFTVESGGPETLDATLAAAAAPQTIVPLAGVPAGPVADYFTAPPLKRDITAGYLDFIPEAYFRPIDVTAYYDALAFVATTTRARPLVYANDQINPQVTNAAAVNFGFESGTDGWFAPAANEVSGYAVKTTRALPYAGNASALLVRTTARAYGKDYGELRQRISAIPYRGQRVRLRAAIRTALAPGARVHMWMRTGAAYDGMHDRPITGHTGWQLRDIVLDVPATATTIQLGFVLVGDGAAWFDAVSLEVVPVP